MFANLRKYLRKDAERLLTAFSSYEGDSDIQKQIRSEATAVVWGYNTLAKGCIVLAKPQGGLFGKNP